MQLLRFDPTAAYLPSTGLEPAQVQSLEPTLAKLREEMVDIDMQMLAGKLPIPESKQPLDAAFYSLPERLLAEYEADRKGSELGRILSVAKRFQERLDRVVVLGIGGSYMGARALLDACCQPYWNELSRGARGSRPRMYFEGNNVDNDASQALLRLLASEPVAAGEPNWGIVVISKSGGTLETAAAFRQFLSALEMACGNNAEAVRARVIPVTGDSGKLFNFAKELACPEVFPVPDGVGGRFSVLSAVGLVPAAILGLNVIELLQGAAAMNKHFREAAPRENVVLQYAAVNHLMEVKRGASVRLLSVWSKALESAGMWYDQLLAESLGKHLKGAMPLTTVNTRDLHSRHQQHQEGRRDKLVNNLIVENYRDDALAIGARNSDPDGLNELAHRTLPEVMNAAIQGTNQALRDDNRPSTNIYLPRTDEASLGQYFQMLMLATVIEGRLLGVNPYGQPGVEAYKKNMNRLLGRK